LAGEWPKLSPHRKEKSSKPPFACSSHSVPIEPHPSAFHFYYLIITIRHDHHEREVGEEKEGETSSADEIFVDTSTLTHFSYHAFEGKTGKKLWSHESGDFLSDSSGPAEETEFVQSHYKVDVRIPLKHEGEIDWRKYRHSIIQTLPHRWRAAEDTSLSLASFHKNKKRSGDQKTAFHQDATGVRLNIEALVPTAQSGPAAQIEGNVVVAFLHDSIEVLQLHSGQPLCRVPLTGDEHGGNGVYADINGDGVIDHVVAITGKNNQDCKAATLLLFALSLSSSLLVLVFRGRGKAKKPSLCHMVVYTGIPAATQLFNGSLCNNGGPVDEFFLNAAHYLEEGLAQSEESKDDLQTVDPVLIPMSVNLSIHQQIK